MKEGDRSLASFSIEHDMLYRVPLLRQALAAGRAKGSEMRVFASPQYIVRFVKACEQAGIPLWRLTI